MYLDEKDFGKDITLIGLAIMPVINAVFLGLIGKFADGCFQ